MVARVFCFLSAAVLSVALWLVVVLMTGETAFAVVCLFVAGASVYRLPRHVERPAMVAGSVAAAIALAWHLRVLDQLSAVFGG